MFDAKSNIKSVDAPTAVWRLSWFRSMRIQYSIVHFGRETVAALCLVADFTNIYHGTDEKRLLRTSRFRGVLIKPRSSP